MNLWSNALAFSAFGRLAIVEWLAALGLYLASGRLAHSASRR
jgi:hypothetical protein